jgi:hypothetical protein
LSLRSEDQITSAGDDTTYQLVIWIHLLFMSIEVLAIARSSRGLCWDTNAPTLKPFAQKLISAFLLGMTSGLTLYSFHRQLSSATP